MRRLLWSLPVLMVLTWSQVAEARDWFVRAGALGGDGSREKPFADPWMALERVEANDKVHVAAGTYFGRYEGGNWQIEFPGVQLLGGYDTAFATRNPWANPTELSWRKDSPNRPLVSSTRITTSASRDTAGATVDGFWIDMQHYYEYGVDGSFNPLALGRNGAVDLGHGGVLRNCIILNSIRPVTAAPGALIENNLIVNSIYAAVTQRGGGGNGDPPVVVRNNTIAVVWGTKAIGDGGNEGVGVTAMNKITVEDNLIVHADNHGVSMGQTPKSTFSGNAFWRNLYSNLAFYADGKSSSLGDADLDSVGDIDFVKAGGNAAVDPKLAFDPTWYDRYLQRTAAHRSAFDAAAWSETRASAGLPPSTDKLDVFAPAYPPQAAAALMAPQNPAVKQGARVRSLPVSFGPPAAVAPARAYARVALDALLQNPKAYEGKAVELILGVGGVANADVGLDGITVKTHKAIHLVDARAQSRTLGIFRQGTWLERFIDAVPDYGSGPPRDLFVVRGIARARDGMPKNALVIDAIVPRDQPEVTTVRPKGRSWFVRAGESGGDGSREQPFHDPYKALEKAAPGDVIHVAEGEYGGKLKNGKWIIDKKYLVLLGGWDREFRVRDPWKTPSLLHWPTDSKTQGQGPLLEGTGDHTGLIVDGFAFDRRSLNLYDQDGFIVPSRSDVSEHVVVFSPESVVRNCTFVNGAGGAARISNGVTFENNIIANVWTSAIKVTSGFGTRVARIRNNTILFVFSRGDFHDGSNSTGSGIELSPLVPAIVEGNLIQYVDNFAIKSNANLNEVAVTNNSFFRNWSTFRTTKNTPPPTVDENSMHLMAHLPLRRADGNVVVDGGFTLEPGFYSSWFARTSPNTSRFTVDDWKAIAPSDAPAEPVKAGIGFLDWRKVAQLVPTHAQARGARPRKLSSEN